MIFLGLSGVADDDVGSKCGICVERTNSLDPVEKPVTVTESTHPAEQRTRRVLQRQIEVADTGRQDRVDEAIVEIRGIEIQQANPFDSLGNRRSQFVDLSSPDAGIASVGALGSLG